MGKTVTTLGEGFLDLLSPNCCCLCLMRCPGPIRLCRACLSDIEVNTPCCPRCAIPMSVGEAQSEIVCAHCQQNPPRFDRALVPRLYEPPISQLISQLKFGADAGIANVLAELMAGILANHLEQFRTPDFLVPMPLYWWRKMRRGFNQAELLAHALNIHPLLQHHALRVNTKLCWRKHATRRQIDLSAAARSVNLKDAFACTPLSESPHIAIVDDILTTGASANALADSLYNAGAGRVDLWACARTPSPG